MIKTVSVIGSGKMGTDIFYYLRDFDLNIIWKISRNADKDEITGTFTKKMNRLKKNGLITDDKYKFIIDNTTITNTLDDIKNSDLTIESIIENKDAKKALYEEIEAVVRPETIIASNSSSFTSVELFKNMRNRTRCYSVHFFYPVKLRTFTELVISSQNSDKQLNGTITDFLNTTMLSPFVENDDTALLLNRLSLPIQGFVFYIYVNSDFSIDELDEMTISDVSPDGVFKVFDSIGLKTIQNSVNNYSNYDPDFNFLYGKMLDILEAHINNNMKLTESSIISGFKNKNSFFSGLSYDDVKNFILAFYINSILYFTKRFNLDKNELNEIIIKNQLSDPGPFDLEICENRNQLKGTLERLAEVTKNPFFKECYL